MYQALYRKYRPQTFSDVVGQKSVTDTLRAQLETGKLSHAYLFTGTRGTGKTSCAKILAKAVNCETRTMATLRAVPVVPRHRRGQLHGRAGDRRGLEQRRRFRPRSA